MEAEKVIAIAKAEVGYLEKKSAANLDSKTENAGSGNFTKYWEDIDKGLQGKAWCNAFVNWCFIKAYGKSVAKKLLCSDTGWSYYTPTSAEYFKAKKQWYSSPKKGDVIYFKNAIRIHHIGIVYKVAGGRVYTIEGNTSAGKQVIANGGGVCKKDYAVTDTAIAGYGRPNYSTESQTQSTTTKTAVATTAALASAKGFDKNIAGTYTTTANLNVRTNAGTGAAIIGMLAKGTKVQCYGYFNTNGGVRWYLIKSGSLTGYCSSAYLQK